MSTIERVAAPTPPAEPKRDSRLGRGWTGFVGAVVEAWAEVRIHKTQVLLSLIGVGVAVTTLALVVAAGAIATQSYVETSERYGGRPALLNVQAYDPMTGAQPDADRFDLAFAEATERYGITYTSRVANGAVSVQFPDGVSAVYLQGIDVDYPVMHRLALEGGAWFTDRDTQRLAPAIVISEEVWMRLGSPDLRLDPTLDVVLPTGPRTVIIVGVTPATSPDGTNLTGFLLNDDFATIVPSDPMYGVQSQYEAWVPPEAAADLSERLRQDIAGMLGDGWDVQVNRWDYLAYNTEDPLLIPKIVVGGVAVLVMILGALGLLNIALVSVRHRIREIGIRRAFGATAGRVFFSVMMESVVATFVAGLAGVLLAIVLVRNPITEYYVGFVVQDIPGFPVEAALIGLGSATLVGALAGLLPALVAVRVKVIDAIRY